MNRVDTIRYAEGRALFYSRAKEGTSPGAGMKFDRVWSLSRSYARLQEAECNYGLTPRQESRQKNIEQEISGICEELGFRVRFDGDPRGYTVRIFFPTGEYNSWGGEEDGWGIN